ncbi:MAG: response regulator [Hyphomicrobiaceae bacterium]
MDEGAKLASYLPPMRRFARVLIGSQKGGDALVLAALQSIVQQGSEPGSQVSKIDLYRHLIIMFDGVAGRHVMELGAPRAEASEVDVVLSKVLPKGRQAFLLSAMEGFSDDEAREILDVSKAEFDRLRVSAFAEIAREIATDVLIIEDEVFIARDLAAIMTRLGHRVIGRARTHKEAIVVLAGRKPGLILADIQLADGSNGIDAVNEILGLGNVPVVFITAFPERLLTGKRPEPTFLIAKPFCVDEVRAVVSQVLFFADRSSPGDGGGMKERAAPRFSHVEPVA